MIDVDRLLALGRGSDARVGVGLPAGVIESVRSSLGGSDCRVRLKPYADTDSLLSALSRGDVDCAVRGVLSSSDVVKKLSGLCESGTVMRAALLEDHDGRRFLLAPVGIDEGASAQTRLEIAERTIRYFSRVGWDLSVAVLSKGRFEDSSRGNEIRVSLKEGEMIAGRLRASGRDAKHYGILVEEAVKERDLLLAPDGISGNLMFRTLHFLGGTRAYGAPVVSADKVFVDTSRAKQDFSEPVLLAAGLSEARLRA